MLLRTLHHALYLQSTAELKDKFQGTFSTIINIIKVIFLFLTFVSIVPFKNFRTRRVMQIQTQLCLALFFGHISFMALGTVKASDTTPCTVGVIIVQYLFLASIAWTVCAAVTLYEKVRCQSREIKCDSAINLVQNS